MSSSPDPPFGDDAILFCTAPFPEAPATPLLLFSFPGAHPAPKLFCPPPISFANFSAARSLEDPKNFSLVNIEPCFDAAAGRTAEAEFCAEDFATPESGITERCDPVRRESPAPALWEPGCVVIRPSRAGPVVTEVSGGTGSDRSRHVGGAGEGEEGGGMAEAEEICRGGRTLDVDLKHKGETGQLAGQPDSGRERIGHLAGQPASAMNPEYNN